MSVKDIILLTGRVNINSDFKQLIEKNNTVGNYLLTEDESEKLDCIRYTSIHKYRGLERKVVILTDIHNKDYAELNYLGASRAKVKLFLMLPQESLDKRTSLIKNCKPFV